MKAQSSNSLNQIPMRLLAQFDDVFVYQTSAFLDMPSSVDTLLAQNKQRLVGQSQQTSYGDFNLGLHVRDDAEQVLTNRMRLLAGINEHLRSKGYLDIHNLRWVNQVHGKQVHNVDTDKLSVRPTNADALISRQIGIGLAVMTADCVPIVLYQPTTNTIAAIHAGWQGLACGVIKSTADLFSIKEPVIAWIGVCISQEHYEVGYEVRDKLLAGCQQYKLLSDSDLNQFDRWFVKLIKKNQDHDKDNSDDLKSQTKDVQNTIDKLSNCATLSEGKIKLNLPKIAAAQLATLGIKVANELPLDCSYANTHYYSYRRQTHLQQSATGRMALIIVRSTKNT